MRTAFLFSLSFLLPFASFAGQVDTIRVQSSSMQKQIPCTVIYPDSYKAGHTSYPVLYLLHGRSGNYKSWLGISPDLPKYADQYQIIVICPDGGDYSWYMNSPVVKGFNYETFTAVELVNYMDKNYRTRADRYHRAIAGLSMGGHGALYLAITHPDVFGAAVSISGGLDMREFDSSMRSVLPDIKEQPHIWEQHTVFNLIDSLKNKQLAIAIDCGVNDGFITVNRNVHQKLLALEIDHDYTERPGAHTGQYWGNSLLYQLVFINSFFTKEH
jgi:S-formylglutathione hydrolase FrmB